MNIRSHQFETPQFEGDSIFAKPAHEWSTAQERNRQLIVWCVCMAMVFLGSVLRVVAVFQYSPTEILITDPGRWWFDATHLFSREPITAIDAFGYQLWLGLVIKLFGTAEQVIILHNALLSVLTPWIWHRFVKELTQDDEIALASWALLCWVPSWITIYSYTMSETLFLPLLGASLWVTFRSRRTGSTGSLMSASACWAATAATRVFALPIALVGMFWALYGASRPWRKLSLASLAFASLTIPLSMRCHSVLGSWNPFGFPEMNQIYMESGKRTIHVNILRNHGGERWQYEFASPVFYEEPLSPVSDWKSDRAGVVKFSINEENGVADWDRALKNNEPTLATRFQIWKENYIFFNFAPSWPDNNPNRFWDRVSIMSRWLWAPLGVVVLAFAVRFYRYTEKNARLFVLITCSCWLLTPLLPAVMEGRYRKPVGGMLVVSFVILWNVWKQNWPVHIHEFRADAISTAESANSMALT